MGYPRPKPTPTPTRNTIKLIIFFIEFIPRFLQFSSFIFRMAFFKLSSIYDVVTVFRWSFWIPDGTLNADHSVSLKAKDIIIFLCLEILNIFFGICAFYSDREIIESPSEIINGGTNFLIKSGFIIAFITRLVIFGFKNKFWEIVELLKKCDLLVISIDS
jgi:hypothetical protein